MNKPYIHPDDLPPVQATQLDELLLRQLEETIGKRFYQACGPITRVLLSSCHWYFTTNASALTLMIICYDMESYWHIDSAIPQIIPRLRQFSDNAKIRLSHPSDTDISWEIPLNSDDENWV